MMNRSWRIARSVRSWRHSTSLKPNSIPPGSLADYRYAAIHGKNASARRQARLDRSRQFATRVFYQRRQVLESQVKYKYTSPATIVSVLFPAKPFAAVLQFVSVIRTMAQLRVPSPSRFVSVTDNRIYQS